MDRCNVIGSFPITQCNFFVSSAAFLISYFFVVPCAAPDVDAELHDEVIRGAKVESLSIVNRE
jgi:hypothetical protein